MPGSILLMVTYVSAAVFVAAVAWRAVKLVRLPVHLRWELYPVAHEKGRAAATGARTSRSRTGGPSLATRRWSGN